MDPEELQRAKTKQWLEIYQLLKPGTALEIRDASGNIEDNLLNSAIWNRAPIHVINKIIDTQSGLVFKQNSKNYNLPLHFAIASPDPDLELIRRLFDAFPEAVFIQNKSGKHPFDVINPNLPRDNPKKYVQLGKLIDELIADAKANELLKEEGLEQENREKKSAKNSLKREKKAKKKESQAEAERQAKIQALTNRSKERQASIIQQRFRRHLEKQRERAEAAKKGINLSAAPFVPSRKPPPTRLLRSSSAPAIMKVYPQLPDDTSVRLPWVGVNYIEGRPKRYFNFGRKRTKLKRLKSDLKRLKLKF
jgi:hypothetical protein